MPTPTLMPASTSCVSARSRWCGGAVPGSVRRQISCRASGSRTSRRPSRAARGCAEHVEVADDHRAARDDRERVRGVGRAPRCTRASAVAALRRLVRIGRRADHDGLALPRRSRQLAAQHLGDVRLHPDARAVAVVRRAVGAPLERTDVTERAAVDAAHVGVERPPEAHALHTVQRGAAGSSRYSTRIRGPVYRTYVRKAGRARTGDPARDPAAADRAAARPLLPAPRRRRLDARRHRPRPDGDAVAGDPRAGSTAPVVRIFITHMHPDHVGGAEAAAAATGAPVLQGRLDYAQCERVWGSPDWPEHIAAWFLRNGVPPEIGGGADRVRPRVRRLRPLRVEPDARRAGRRDRRLAGPRDARPRRRPPRARTATACSSPATRCSRRSRPAIGLYPESRPDPLGDYLDSLRALAELAPRVSYGGHGETVDEPARARARDRRSPRRAARPHRGRARRRAAQRLRRLARALRARAAADPAPLRRRRDALAPRAARRARARRRGTRTTGSSPILRAQPVDEKPSEYHAPRAGGA